MQSGLRWGSLYTPDCLQTCLSPLPESWDLQVCITTPSNILLLDVPSPFLLSAVSVPSVLQTAPSSSGVGNPGRAWIKRLNKIFLLVTGRTVNSSHHTRPSVYSPRSRSPILTLTWILASTVLTQKALLPPCRQSCAGAGPGGHSYCLNRPGKLRG